MYGTYNKPYLHRVAAAKLKHAAEELQTLQPGWKLLIFDGLRPRTVQRKLWARVVGTENAQYVADPDKGSVHNYGFAVDLSLQNSRGEEVDMGTPFDSFQATAQPDLEEKLLQEGKLKQEQIDHRKILRKVMVDAGFTQLSNEWWHYDALPLQEIKKHYKIVE